MLIEQDYLDSIKNNLNINIYEAKIWIALLSRGIATASQLADISGVPRSRCYDVLETLEKEGFVITKLGKPIKYIAIKPEEVIERQKKVIRKEAERRVQFVDNIKATEVFKELGFLHTSGIDKVNIEDLTGSYKGKSEIKKQMKDMIKAAKKSITFMTTKSDVKKHIKLLESSNKGVNVVIGVPDKSGIKPNGFKLGEVDFDSRFLSVDGDKALFMISDGISDADEDYGVMVKSPFLIKALDSMFRANMR